jgi:hypothetical protein
MPMQENSVYKIVCIGESISGRRWQREMNRLHHSLVALDLSSTLTRSSQRTTFESTKYQHQSLHDPFLLAYPMKWLIIRVALTVPIQKQHSIHRNNYTTTSAYPQPHSKNYPQTMDPSCTIFTAFVHLGLAHFSFALLLYFLSSLN